jgi:hypothetical protein
MHFANTARHGRHAAATREAPRSNTFESTVGIGMDIQLPVTGVPQINSQDKSRKVAMMYKLAGDGGVLHASGARYCFEDMEKR